MALKQGADYSNLNVTLQEVINASRLPIGCQESVYFVAFATSLSYDKEICLINYTLKLMQNL